MAPAGMVMVGRPLKLRTPPDVGWIALLVA
jgi:hypothetical protein